VRRILLAALILLSAHGNLGCFFYDSRWGQAKAEQRRAAQRQSPVELGRSTKESRGLTRRTPAELRSLRLRAHATPEYVAETVNWERQVSEIVGEANTVLAELGVQLVVEGARLWRPELGSGTLELALNQLREHDSGSDIDYVVGLVGSLPRVEFAFHQLGMAGLLGKHMVLRAMNDAAEFRAIQERLDELDEGERQRLYRSRKRHKNASVLLHELGHALGALHVNDAKDLMHPRYSPEARGFGDETRALIGIALRRPHHAADPHERRLLVEESLAELRARSASVWIRGERERRIADLEQALASARPPPSATSRPKALPAPASAPPPPRSAELAEADRERLRNAERELAAGRHRDAWSAAEPLFERYPSDYTVQELRCKIASGMGLPWDELRRQCQPVMQLTPGVPEWFR
jgi:hypothetical protein